MTTLGSIHLQHIVQPEHGTKWTTIFCKTCHYGTFEMDVSQISKSLSDKTISFYIMLYSSITTLSLLTVVMLVSYDKVDARFPKEKARKVQNHKEKGGKKMMKSIFSVSQPIAPIPSSAPTLLHPGLSLTTPPTLLASRSPTIMPAQVSTSAPVSMPSSTTTQLPTSSPTPVIKSSTTSPTSLPTLSLNEEWLHEHNIRREAFYNLFPEYNITIVPLKWSHSVAASAQNYAEQLIASSGCNIEHNYNGDSYGGENLAMNHGSGRWAKARTPAQVLTAWYNDEIDLDTMNLVGQKYHASQVIFRSTKYLGCGSAQKEHSGGTCHIQVCRYLRAGNCFLETYVSQHPSVKTDLPAGCLNDYPGTDWLCSTLGDDVSKYCHDTIRNPHCPTEGCF
mmetsp:Transcript_14170/g.21833  ORF Transcript_14170/g.21833 Transcript_14170/m.21833 type:complete len:392 (-) Transcript_14170:88-1263(-)